MARPFRATERAPDIRARRCPWHTLCIAARCFVGGPPPPAAAAWDAPAAATDPNAWYVALRRARRDGAVPVVPADAGDGGLGAAFIAAAAVCLDADGPPPPIHFASAAGRARFAAMVHMLDVCNPHIRQAATLGAVADCVARWCAAMRAHEPGSTAARRRRDDAALIDLAQERMAAAVHAARGAPPGPARRRAANAARAEVRWARDRFRAYDVRDAAYAATLALHELAGYLRAESHNAR